MTSQKHFAPIQVGRLGLRLLEERDLATTLAWRNQERVLKMLVNTSPLTLAEHQSWFLSYQRTRDLVLIIEEHGQPVGQVSVYNLDEEPTFGRLIIGSQSAVGSGIAMAASFLALSYVFDVLRCKHIVLSVRKDNSAAIAIYQRCGFRDISSDGELLSMRLDHCSSQWESWSLPACIEITKAWEHPNEISHRESLAHAISLEHVNGILDVGCGAGKLLDAFAGLLERSFDYTGIDNSFAMLGIAKERHRNASLRFASASSLPFPAQSFDGVCCFEVLKHVPRECAHTIVRELVRVSKRKALFSVAREARGEEMIGDARFLELRHDLGDLCSTALSVRPGLQVSQRPLPACDIVVVSSS